MRLQSFDELLSLDVPCHLASTSDSALLLIGDAAAELAPTLATRSKVTVEQGAQRLMFGLPFYTAPYPLLVAALVTEKNTVFNALSLFGWIEDNFITEPRAEVFGLTPYGEQPVMFVRDFDLDRPIEAWLQSGQPVRWLRVSGIAIASARHMAGTQTLKGDAAAVVALESALPADAQDFVERLRLDVARGVTLRAALRARRKFNDAQLMTVCDGWRVLANAVPVVRINPAGGDETPLRDLLPQ
jgi:hypothetical protein